MLCKVCCSEVRIPFLQGGERQTQGRKMKIVDFSVTASAGSVTNNQSMSWMGTTTRTSRRDALTRLYRNAVTGKSNVFFSIKWDTVHVVYQI